MTMIFLVVLFITQVISFYFIALLYMKVSKFDDLEKKQNRLMREMDDALAVYLAEVKDENDQLIQEITRKMSAQKHKTTTEKKAEVVERKKESAVIVPVPQNTMRQHARQSYEAVKKTEQVVVEPDDRMKAIQMFGQGYSVEEIAKKLGKGKTEIELILKFN